MCTRMGPELRSDPTSDCIEKTDVTLALEVPPCLDTFLLFYFSVCPQRRDRKLPYKDQLITVHLSWTCLSPVNLQTVTWLMLRWFILWI